MMRDRDALCNGINRDVSRSAKYDGFSNALERLSGKTDVSKTCHLQRVYRTSNTPVRRLSHIGINPGGSSWLCFWASNGK
jgi:hypothetical protein